MSALPLEADVALYLDNVGFVPGADIGVFDVRQSGCNHRSLAVEHSCWSGACHRPAFIAAQCAGTLVAHGAAKILHD
jgi:hypothetical protein